MWHDKYINCVEHMNIEIQRFVQPRSNTYHAQLDAGGLIGQQQMQLLARVAEAVLVPYKVHFISNSAQPAEDGASAGLDAQP
jgi:hypothetical protein